MFKNAMVYEEEISDQNLAFRFFQEGVRLLKFRSGLTQNELLEFIGICLGLAQSGDFVGEDLVG